LWANSHQAAAAVILENVSKIPAETVGTMARVEFPASLDRGTIQPTIDAMAHYKFIPRDFNVSEMFWRG
jgi:hypothetical protein